MTKQTATKFSDLLVGQSFDFINDERVGYNSFFQPCVKTSARNYERIDTRTAYTIGSINCIVYHVDKHNVPDRHLQIS